MNDLVIALMQRGNLHLVDKLREFLTPKIRERAMDMTVSYGTSAMLDYLLTHYGTEATYKHIVTAIIYGNAPLVQHLLRLVKPSYEELVDLQHKAITESKSGAVYEIFEELLPIDPYTALSELLASEHSKGEMAHYLLSRIPSDSDLSLLLITSHTSYGVLLELAEDKRMNTSAALDNLLDRASLTPIIASAIGRSDMINVFTVEPEQAKRLIRSMNLWTSGLMTLDFSFVVAEMTFKRRRLDDAGLLRWMIESPQLQNVRLAAHLVTHSGSTLASQSIDVLALRALLISLLYPSMNTEVALDFLRIRDHYSADAIDRSWLLLLVLENWRR